MILKIASSRREKNVVPSLSCYSSSSISSFYSCRHRSYRSSAAVGVGVGVGVSDRHLHLRQKQGQQWLKLPASYGLSSSSSSSSSSSDGDWDRYVNGTTTRWMSTTTTTTTTNTSESDKDDSTDKKSTTAASTAASAAAAKGGDAKVDDESHLKNKKTMEFQAETKQLLDIVTNSLYTDKDVFLRELISNASDALEKMRHYQQIASTNNSTSSDQQQLPLEINITLDEVESTITISDTGIGMTADELVENLGTIAKSGSKQFMAQLAEETSSGQNVDPESVRNAIIGRFGVGFYSVFMVAHKVQVTTKSQKSIDDDGGHNSKATVWTSDGTGTYELAELDESDEDGGLRVDRGTSIKIFLDSDYWGMLQESKIKDILTKYSNFVQFSIYLNGELVNTIQAVWSMDPKEVEYDTYVDFYKYISHGAIDDPLDILHFRADAPIDIQALLFIPSFHTEKYGMERMQPGVSLYSRKVLIEGNGQSDILPDWLRFVKGVVDSQDLPLAISREKPQDSALIGKLRKALTRRFLSQLEKMAKYVPYQQKSKRNDIGCIFCRRGLNCCLPSLSFICFLTTMFFNMHHSSCTYCTSITGRNLKSILTSSIVNIHSF